MLELQIRKRQSTHTNSFRERFQARLEDVLKLSRRSLFGRVIRLPALFPFRRKESDDSDIASSSDVAHKQQHADNSSEDDPAGAKPAGLLRGLFGNRKRAQADSERQMISINGKQFYVDDEGELKEFKSKTKS